MTASGRTDPARQSNLLMASPGRRRRLAMAVAILLMAVSGVVSYAMMAALDKRANDQTLTYDVRRQANDLAVAFIEAESAQRGYLLTLDPQYLEPYAAAGAAIGRDYARLVESARRLSTQPERIVGLAGAIAQKQSEMQRTLDMASHGDLAGALALVRSGEGQTLMTTIRDTLKGFLAEQDARLSERNAGAELARRVLVAALFVTLGGAALLAFALQMRTESKVAGLERSSRRLMERNEELEARVAARTAELLEATAHAERERQRLELLLQDTNHRIGNSLATVSSLLGLQLNRAASDEARHALEAARGRVQAIAAGHRRLRLGTDLETTRIDEFLEAVIDDQRAALTGERRVALVTDCQPVVIKARDATTVGILAGELVTNALKHAFKSGAGGTVTTRFGRDPSGVLVLEVEDDGDGGGAGGSGSGLGSLIVTQLARQFGGEPAYSRGVKGGTLVTVRMPALESAA